MREVWPLLDTHKITDDGEERKRPLWANSDSRKKFKPIRGKTEEPIQKEGRKGNREQKSKHPAKKVLCRLPHLQGDRGKGSTGAVPGRRIR